MIEEIKKMLIGDKEIKLECVNMDKYIHKDSESINTRERILKSGLIVTGVTPDDMALFLKGTSYCIPVDEFKYFRIEGKEATFDDLIDVAVKACKDDKIYFRFLSSDQISFTVDNAEEGKINIMKQSCGQEEIKEAIELINSLYTETFVIDKEILILKVKDEAKVTLANGNSFIAREVEHGFVAMKDGSKAKSLMFRDSNDFWTTYSFFELKGATVTQRKKVLQ